MARDDEQSTRGWQAALQVTLADAIEHLQALIFEEGWDALRAAAGSDEVALRESVARYEQELARLFSFLRVSGALADAVAWLTMKVEMRRAALDAGAEISLRTALESGFYAAEPVSLGDHATYLRWAAALTGFLTSLASASAVQPGPGAGEDERLRWAYETLASLEEHDVFHSAFADWLRGNSTDRVEANEVIDLQASLLSLPRFDLVLNTSLRWLAMLPAS